MHDETRLGFNTGYVEQLYRQYLDNPESVSESWREFFADYRPSESFVAATEARKAVVAASGELEAEVAAAGLTAREGDGAVSPAEPAAAELEFEAEIKPLRGASAKIVENMEASIHVPTATSVRTFAVKLMAENRKLINDYQRNSGGEKVSYTHMIAWAIVQGLRAFPSMYTTFRRVDGKPEHVIPEAINLGLAIDIERRGRRTLMVPNIKNVGDMTFPQFLGIYNDLVGRARDNELEISDFRGTTATITNPGMIGTSLSVPRLMPNQGVIVGVGSIGYPPEYHAFAPDIVSRTGISPVMTITSTYDHRVIQGAESGAFLAHIAQSLLGERGFYSTLFTELNIPYQPFVLTPDNTPQLGADGSETDMIQKQARVLQLIRAHRVRGHLQADINPLGYEWVNHPELDPATYGLTVWDLDRKFVTGGLGGVDILPLREILSIVREAYSRKFGIEYMHISDPTEKAWLEDRVEPVGGLDALVPELKRRVLSKLNAAEAFERFLHTKYIGHKRFSLEGSETVIPMLDMILSNSADQGVHEVVMGMAHRGRLNVLANILHKPYEVIFSEFEGSLDPNTMQGSGDVKYHLGATGTHESPDGNQLKVTLASNPSHLEAVNPVVEGMVRAKQYKLRHQVSDVPGGDYKDAVIPLLIHGDAAFAGQGVVAETLNLSQLSGYHTGGTIHVVINNQIGFTTTPSDARSSTYATDVARMIQAPIFHVNGDDPEACIRVAMIALDYRQEFNKDVVIDMLCYRVHGHNEGDEPTYTQPLLYRKIEAKRSVRKLYTEYLLRRGEMSLEEAEQMLDDYRARLVEAFERTKEVVERDATKEVVVFQRTEPNAESPRFDTAVPSATLDTIVGALVTFPDGFDIHKKLARQFEKRAKAYEDGVVDWSLGEALAYGSLLLDGTTVRLAGQDSGRGTFSHRHAVVFDQTNGSELVPLNNIKDEQPHLLVYDSLLSEYAACGFEYGYSVADPEALVIWEAQFGDFSNGAQIVFDQFLSAAESKWGQRSSLVLLLPHGYEGQGPEHSSARLERFLQMCAEGNLTVCNLTTPANLFHALRRQVKMEKRKPLIVMSPKSLLRHPSVISSPTEFTEGQFDEVLPATNADVSAVKRIVFCSGKLYFDLMQTAEAHPEVLEATAVVRVEQLYPFPHAALVREVDRFPEADVFVWCQEEPMNMGAWTFIAPRLDDVLASRSGSECGSIQYRGRPASASPSSGSAKVHQVEMEKLISEALDIA
ncbi:MAG: multifunctional oxoglutarate decarboxylase/oxoglutarate dehydrogenase thiamine pyrophosphate-binding subunit/dihydrolipoyllysine-residue succinyltransferase subunit [Rhodothermales bacterium]|nr:multifunctional oxoglutarate decarboxylase/oxoglutarate dehydrogenase thiamine pyrophosphate-binding subunit/dihydrolipoyllysine-residue succinyltransferase subunit [Rhodothermales bacterium]